MISLASLGREVSEQLRHCGYAGFVRLEERFSSECDSRVCPLPTETSHQRLRAFPMQGPGLAGNNEKPKL